MLLLQTIIKAMKLFSKFNSNLLSSSEETEVTQHLDLKHKQKNFPNISFLECNKYYIIVLFY